MQASSISRTASSVATVSALLGSKSDKENIPPAFSSPPHPSMVRYRNPGIIASGRTESSARSSTLLQLLSSPMVSSQPFTESDRPPALASSYTHVRRHRGSGKGILSGESASFSAAGAGMRHVGASSADRFNRMTELVPSDSVSNLANDGNDGGEQERRRDIEPGPKSPLDSTCSFSIASEFSGTHLPDLPSLPETTPSPIMVPLDSFRHRDRIHGGTRGSNDGVESWKEERLHDVKSSGSRQSLTFLRERERQQKENRHTGSANQNAMGDGQLTKSANPTRQGPHVVAGGTGTRGLPIDGSFAAELRSLVTTEEYRKFVKGERP
ncbi:uncharacterized protein EI90DRAFT_3034035, partial [Cantharellus anzutake]|uniref:uncharacterized protein n=1 Tax=Cantharellus anzutake TaxID=1750568 RepID=UPI001903C7A2